MNQQPKTILDRVVDIERNITDIKTSQPVGTSSVRVYEIMTNNQWDVQWTAVEAWPGAGGGAEYVMIEYYADNQLAPFVSLSLFATINDVPYSNVGKYQNVNPINEEYITVGEDFVADTNEWLSYQSGAGRIRFRIQLSTPRLGSVFKIKFKIKATDRGYIRYRLGQQDGWIRG